MQFEGEEIEPVEDPTLVAALHAVRRAHLEYEAADAYLVGCQKVLQTLMEEKKLKSTYIMDEGRLFKTTVVTPERMQVDPEELKKRLGAREWNKFAPRKFDSTLFKALVEKDEIALEAVADLISYKPTKGFVRISPVEPVSD